MAISQELAELTCRLAQCPELGRAGAMRALERDVCGCDYGATSSTTRHEADRSAAVLGLRPGMSLLEVGAGTGWPGSTCRRSAATAW